MTESQSSHSQPEPNEPQPQRRFKRLPVILGVGVLIGVGGATLWTWRFVDGELVPLVTRQLSKTLNRPILLGDIDRLSLTGVRLGASSVPATPTDTDRATIEAVEVKFNPLQFVWTRRLGLRVVLVKPTIYLEQDIRGAWVTAEIKKSDKKGLIEIALDRLELDNGTVMLSSPNWKPETENLETDKPETENRKNQKSEAEDTEKNDRPETTEEGEKKPEETAPQKFAMTTLRRVKGSVEIAKNNDIVRFDVIGYPITKGRLRVKGEYLASREEVKLNISGQDIPAAEISPVLTQTPLAFETGKLYGNVGLRLKIGKDIAPQLEGNARFENLNLQLQGVPQLLSNGKGRMRFSQSAMLIEDTNANYGEIPVEVPQGLLDFEQGYELPVKVPPADVALILDTLQLETPVPVTGEAEAVLKVLGPLNAPVLIGQAQTTDVATIDLVPFSDISGQFAFSVADGTIEIGEIKALPEVGGEVEGIVAIALPPKLENLPNSPSSQPQQTQTPQTEPSPTDETPGESIEPQQDEGSFDNIASDNITSGNIQSKTDGEKSPTPNSQPSTEPEILAEFVARGVPGDAIAQLYGTALPNNLSLGLVDAKTVTTSTAGQLETQGLWEALNGTYPAKGEMQIVGTTVRFQNTLVQVEDSVVQAGGIVTPENWQVALNLNETPISPFLPPDAIASLDLGAATGQIQLAGEMGAFDANGIQALGQIELDAAGGNLQILGQLAQGRWEAQVAGNQVQIAQFLPPSQTPPFPLGTASGRFDLRGSSLTFDANTLEAQGQALVNVAGGGVQADVIVTGGLWQADVDRFELPLAPFIPAGTLPEDTQAAGSGTFSGSLTGFDLNSIQGDSDVTVALGDGGVQGRVRLANGRWQADVTQFQLPLAPFIPAGTLPEDAQTIGRGTFAGSLTEFDPNSVQANALVGLTFAGGIAEGTVTLADGRWNADVLQYQVPLSPFLPADTLPGDAQAVGSGQFAGNLAQFDVASVAANTDVTVAFANGGVQGRVKLADGRWNADVSQYQIPLSPFLPPDTLPGDAQAVGSGQFAGNLNSFDLATVQANTDTIVTFAEDKGARGTVNLRDGGWSAKVEEFLIPLAPFVPPGTLPGDAIAAGNGMFAGNLNSFDAASWQADANVGVVFKGGGAEGAVTLADNRWSARFDRLQVPLASYLPPDLPLSVGTLVKLGKKPLTIAGAVNGFAPENLTAEGTIGLEVEDGEAIIDGSFDRGNWNAEVAAQQLPVASLFPRASLEALTQKQVTLNLQGELAANAILAGTLTDFTPEAIAAALNPGIVREGDLQLTNLQLNDSVFDTVLFGPMEQTSEGLEVKVAGQDGSIVGDRDVLSVLLESPKQPGQPWSYVPLEFQANFDWKGEQRADCAVEEGEGPNPLAPFPQREGGDIWLSESPSPSREGVGEGSISADRNCQRRSVALAEQTYPVQISGRRNGDRLDFTLNNLPLSPFDLKPPASGGLRPPITGAISTNLTWDLAAGTGSGSIQLDRPTLGLLSANSLESQFQYTGNRLVLQETALRKGESEYRLSGRVDLLGKDPQFNGEVQISQGQVQDVLTALQWFDLDDLARGVQPAEYSDSAQLEFYPIGIPEASLFTQLRRFSEIEALLEQQRDRDGTDNPLPRLTQLQGNFDGTIGVRGSLAAGADVNFDLAGDAWQWGEYQANQIIAKGSFIDGILNLQPLDVKANLGQDTETLLSFAGQLGGDRQSAQFSLTNFPSTVLEKFVPFPEGISVSGNLNASATLAGSAVNPQARGEITLVEGKLNDESIDSGRGSFLYSDSRLNFSSQVFIEGTEPIQVAGFLPYQFPGSAVLPANEDFNEDFNVTASVRNEGLALMNSLTDAVEWKGGQGMANVTIAGERIRSGSPENPTFVYLPQTTKGEILLTNAEFASPNLPENLTGVSATARLEDDLLIVDNLQGKFRQGEVTAQGTYSLFGFPLSPDDPEALTVTMTDLELDVKGRYRGGIDGSIGIGGSFLNPFIGGEIRLSNGQILLPDQTAAPTAAQPDDIENAFEPIYENLNLILGEKIQILKPPVLNFIADGKLTVNGTIDNPSADGTIFLKQGLVNIFTTEFTLARNAKNTATFVPEQGLDPNLSVLMRASVPEASHSPLSRDATATSTEIEELAIERGTVETVRIEAQVTGPASQLAENLQLSSSPDRSEREIIALMGGGFINTLGTGDSTLALANLASSVLLTQFQTALNQALGLRDFRLFPTTTSRTSSLTLGAELGINLTDNVSASVLQILDANQPTRFGVRYRIDDNILLRGSSDFVEDTRGEIEIRFRF